YIIPSSIESLMEAEAETSKRAVKQRLIMDYFINHPEPVEQKKLYQSLKINRSNLKPLLEKKLISTKKREVYREPYEQAFPKTTNLTLTEEQQTAIEPIQEAIEKVHHRTFLLHGVTGSGKTEIYLQAIDQVLQKGKEAI